MSARIRTKHPWHAYQASTRPVREPAAAHRVRPIRRVRSLTRIRTIVTQHLDTHRQEAPRLAHQLMLLPMAPVQQANMRTRTPTSASTAQLASNAPKSSLFPLLASRASMLTQSTTRSVKDAQQVGNARPYTLRKNVKMVSTPSKEVSTAILFQVV